MGIVVNCLSLMLSALLIVYGISFYIKNRGIARRINLFILLYCVFSALWCLCFGSIGLADNLDNAEILRKIGDFAIVAFLVNEVFFVTNMFREKKKTIIVLRTVIVIISTSGLETGLPGPPIPTSGLPDRSTLHLWPSDL